MLSFGKIEDAAQIGIPDLPMGTKVVFNHLPSIVFCLVFQDNQNRFPVWMRD